MQNYIRDEEFKDEMEQNVAPFLSQRKTDGYFKSEDGTRIHYRFYKADEEKASIVISHGFCEFIEKYEEVSYYFLCQGYSVYVLEYRGHGKSDRFVEDKDKVFVTSYEEYVADLNSFVEKVVKVNSGNGKLLLFAHSMGGAVGARYLEEYPDTFMGAVLSAPMLEINYGKIPKFVASLMAFYGRVAHLDKEYIPGAHGFDGINVFDTSSCLSRARYERVFHFRELDEDFRTYDSTYGWVSAGMKMVKQIKKDVSKVKTPILLFQAGVDSMVRPGGQQYYAEHTKNTELVRYETSKHEIFNATDDIIKDYYDKIFAFYDKIL